MADTFTKADVERIVAEAVAKATVDLKAAAAKSEQQKEHESQRDARIAKMVALRNKAREIQGSSSQNLKYVVGPAGAYFRRRHYLPGEIISKPNSDDPKDLPSLDYAVFDSAAPKPAPEKKGPLTSAEMNKLDAERPKHGVQAPKKGGRPSDTEV